jgi:predicted enzyme related to lactoylglutathione lyase
MPKKDGFDHGVPSWVDLTTTDVDAAKRFYSGLFGWDWVGNEMSPDYTYWMATLQGELIAGLSAQPPDMAAQGVPSMWNTYVNVDNLDATVARAEKAGATVLMPPMDVPDAGRMAFINDPSGAAVGMWQPGAHKGAGLVNEPGAFVWNEVYAPDTDATVSFYKEVFGWAGSPMTMGDGGDYTVFKLGEAMVGGTAKPQAPDVPPHWHVWFVAADVDASTAKAKELGATVQVQPAESPIGKFAFLQDPTGAAFSIITPNTGG